ncbi:MAG: T9SS type A sorting domain-containing protein [Bacteroidetes bacterium]|nr:T9SS type A sorting domain-containing protein [Bacteroidota bacterium]
MYINELASGVYTIKLYCNDGSKTKKLVVLK